MKHKLFALLLAGGAFVAAMQPGVASACWRPIPEWESCSCQTWHIGVSACAANRGHCMIAGKCGGGGGTFPP